MKYVNVHKNQHCIESINCEHMRFLESFLRRPIDVHAGLERRKLLLKWLTSADYFAAMIFERSRQLEDLKRDLWIECCCEKVEIIT